MAAAPQDREALEDWLYDLYKTVGEIEDGEAYRRHLASTRRPYVPIRPELTRYDFMWIATLGILIAPWFYMLVEIIVTGRAENREVGAVYGRVLLYGWLYCIAVGVVFALVFSIIFLWTRLAKKPVRSTRLTLGRGRVRRVTEFFAAAMVTVLVYGVGLAFRSPSIPIVLVGAILVFVLIVAGTTWVWRRLWNAYAVRRNARIDVLNRPIEEKREIATQQLAPVYQYLNATYGGHFPLEYRNARAVQHLLAIVVNFRASTLQDAINRYVVDLHHERMEASQAAILDQQRLLVLEQRNTRNAVYSAAIWNTAMQAATISAIRRY